MITKNISNNNNNYDNNKNKDNDNDGNNINDDNDYMFLKIQIFNSHVIFVISVSSLLITINSFPSIYLFFQNINQFSRIPFITLPVD